MSNVSSKQIEEYAMLRLTHGMKAYQAVRYLKFRKEEYPFKLLKTKDGLYEARWGSDHGFVFKASSNVDSGAGSKILPNMGKLITCKVPGAIKYSKGEWWYLPTTTYNDYYKHAREFLKLSKVEADLAAREAVRNQAEQFYQYRIKWHLIKFSVTVMFAEIDICTLSIGDIESTTSIETLHYIVDKLAREAEELACQKINQLWNSYERIQKIKKSQT